MGRSVSTIIRPRVVDVGRARLSVITIIEGPLITICEGARM